MKILGPLVDALPVGDTATRRLELIGHVDGEALERVRTVARTAGGVLAFLVCMCPRGLSTWTPQRLCLYVCTRGRETGSRVNSRNRLNGHGFECWRQTRYAARPRVLVSTAHKIVRVGGDHNPIGRRSYHSVCDSVQVERFQKLDALSLLFTRVRHQTHVPPSVTREFPHRLELQPVDNDTVKTSARFFGWPRGWQKASVTPRLAGIFPKTVQKGGKRSFLMV